MSIAIGTYIRFIDADGSDTGNRYQNFFAEETRTYNGRSYIFGGFGFSGGVLDIEAANISASLVMNVNPISLNLIQQAADNFWLVEIRTVWLDPETFSEGSTHGEEIYAVTGFEHDASRISIRLGSPLDAVQQNVPRRVLSLRMVGALPSTGQINLS
jgi:hypothetical protein